MKKYILIELSLHEEKVLLGFLKEMI